MHTHKQVIGVWHVPTNTEKLHQVMKLPVNIAAYLQKIPSARDVILVAESVPSPVQSLSPHYPPRSITLSPYGTALALALLELVGMLATARLPCEVFSFTSLNAGWASITCLDHSFLLRQKGITIVSKDLPR